MSTCYVSMLRVASHTFIHPIQIHMSLTSLVSLEAADSSSSSDYSDDGCSAKWEETNSRDYYMNRRFMNRRYTPYTRQSPYTGERSGGSAWRSVAGAGRTQPHTVLLRGTHPQEVPATLQRQRDLDVKFRALDATWDQRDLDISIGRSCSGDWDVIDRECTCRATWKNWMRKFGLSLYYQDYDHFRWLWIKEDLHLIFGPIEVDTMMRAIGSHVFDKKDVPEVYWRSISLNRG